MVSASAEIPLRQKHNMTNLIVIDIEYKITAGPSLAISCTCDLFGIMTHMKREKPRVKAYTPATL